MGLADLGRYKRHRDRQERDPLYRYKTAAPGHGGMSEWAREFHQAQDRKRAIIAANKIGKAQPLDEPVLTPAGWKPIGEVQVGDEVIGGDGKPKRVIGVYPQGERPVFRVEFSDGAWTRCCREHLWKCRAKGAEQEGWSVRSLGDVLDAGGSFSIPTLPGEADGRGREFASITASGDAECVCIAVEGEERTYVTRGYIVTHNSYALAAEDWFYLLQDHPYRDARDAGPTGACLLSDLMNGWATLSHCLHELEPPGVVADDCHYVEGIGYMWRSKKELVLKNGRRLLVRGCDQKVLSVEGFIAQWGHIDEPPKRGHWNGFRGRLASDLGPYWLSATPVGRPCDWLQETIEGIPEEEKPPKEDDWYVRHIPLSVESAPHRTAESIEAAKAETDEEEYEQRINGGWRGVTRGRKFAGYGGHAIITDDDLFDDETGAWKIRFAEFKASWDYGQRAHTTVGHLLGREAGPDGRVVVLGETVSDMAHEQPIEWAWAMCRLLHALGMHPAQIGTANGDSNSAGVLGAGLKLNQVMEMAFRQIVNHPVDPLTGEALWKPLRTAQPPFEIRGPAKGAGSVDFGVQLMNMALLRHRFLVHESCRQLDKSMRHWRGADDDLKHAVDACRYGVYDWLTPLKSAGQGALLLRA